jgi:hypothetical protein
VLQALPDPRSIHPLGQQTGTALIPRTGSRHILGPLNVNLIHHNQPAARACKSFACFAISLCLIPLPLAAQIRALNYDTPSYIEVERSEIRAHEGTATVTINLIRTGEFRLTTKVDYSLFEQSATAGEDFKPAGGTVVFKPGEGFKTISLELLADDEAEPDETFALKLSASHEQTIIISDTVTMVIQDMPPAISDIPILNITAADHAAIKLSWQGHADATLERAANPESVAWEPVRCTVQMTGSTCEVTELAAGKFYFYRLRAR